MKSLCKVIRSNRNLLTDNNDVPSDWLPRDLSAGSSTSSSASNNSHHRVQSPVSVKLAPLVDTDCLSTGIPPNGNHKVEKEALVLNMVQTQDMVSALPNGNQLNWEMEPDKGWNGWRPAEILPPKPSSPPVDIKALQEKLIFEAQEKALRAAEEQAALVVQEATKNADEIVTQARASASEITRQAHQAGLAIGQAEAIEMLALAQKVVDELRVWREEMFARTEPQVLSLIQDIAYKIFGNGLVLDKEILSKAFENALAEAKPLGDLRIRVHPEDVALLGPLWPTQQTAMSGQHIELIPDQDIQRGGCYIEGQYGSVDGSVEKQLSQVSETLADVLAADALASNPFTTYGKGELTSSDLEMSPIQAVEAGD
jgi:flagellar assembly protein FliH